MHLTESLVLQGGMGERGKWFSPSEASLHDLVSRPVEQPSSMGLLTLIEFGAAPKGIQYMSVLPICLDLNSRGC